jgi:serine/threonine protein kinase
MPLPIKQDMIGEDIRRVSFSYVCKGTNTKTSEDDAIKILPQSNLSTEEEIGRFHREIETMAHLRHDHLVA